MKDYEITKEPNVDPSTISRDIGYLYSIILIYIVQLKEPFTWELQIGYRCLLSDCVWIGVAK